MLAGYFSGRLWVQGGGFFSVRVFSGSRERRSGRCVFSWQEEEMSLPAEEEREQRERLESRTKELGEENQRLQDELTKLRADSSRRDDERDSSRRAADTAVDGGGVVAAADAGDNSFGERNSRRDIFSPVPSYSPSWARAAP